MSKKCLFTDEELAADTKSEHTIPKSIGGRIESTEVSSSVFNERAGDTCDRRLARLYQLIFTTLGRALPGGGPNSCAISTRTGKQFTVEPGGRPKLSKIEIPTRHPGSNKPESILGDRLAVERLVKNSKLDVSKATKSYEPATKDGEECAVNMPLMDAMAEVGMLKAVLLSFDHLLANSHQRFPRNPALKEVVADVKRWVMRDDVDVKNLAHHVLGLQQDKLALLRRLRNQIATPVTPFEHFLIASANPWTRSLDIAWSIAGIETWAFRLCWEWKAEPFICGVASGILRNTSTSPLTWIVDEPPTFEPTGLRAVHLQSELKHQAEQAGEIVATYRADALLRASNYVEENCDEFVIECIRDAAVEVNGSEFRCKVQEGVERRLRRVFFSRIEQQGPAHFDHVISTMAPRGDDVFDLDNFVGINWKNWLRRYRDLHRTLQDAYGVSQRMTRTGIKVTRSSASV